jgi:hypothetical protein
MKVPESIEVNKQRFPKWGKYFRVVENQSRGKETLFPEAYRDSRPRKGVLEERCEWGNCSFCQGIKVQFLYYLEGSKRGIPKPGSTKNRYHILS